MPDLFKVKLIEPDDTELTKIGFDSSYVSQGANKHKFVSLKIHSLTPAQANIIKQTALACGTDAAVHREVITGKAEKSDCILSGSISELKKISKKLSTQPFSLSKLGNEILEVIYLKPEPLTVKKTVFDWECPYIMGIVNITPDSFSDGGKYNDVDAAYNHACALISDGADIIDIGGESTRPYAQKISVEEEIDRVIPLIKKIRSEFPDIPLSIDTRNSQTAKLALEAGVDIINDVSAGEWDAEMKNIAREFDAPFILNHSKGTPENMQDNPVYKDIKDEIFNYFYAKISELIEYGLNKSKLIIDPGIGFGKTKEQNFELLKNISELKSLGFPILVGHSRKNFLKKSIGADDIETLDKATNVLSTHLINSGVNILRVHNVRDLKMQMNINMDLF